MLILLQVVTLLIITLSVCYYRLKPIIWTGVIAAVLLICTVLSIVDPFVLAIAWVLFIFSAIYANVTFIRKYLIVAHLIKFFRKVLPPMSETERAALEAGGVWWEGELFRGNPNWSKLHAYPKPTLSFEEESFLNNQVENLCNMLDDFKIVADGDLPPEVWNYLKKERFFSLIIPKQYGGLEFSALAQSTIVTKIATRSLSAAVTTMVPNSLGPGELLLHYGTEEQKNYYLPRLADGREIPCFALTSVAGGSDAGAMWDKGIVCKGMHEGKEVLGIRLTFDKRYITLAPVATVLGLAFKLYDPEHLLGDKQDIGITCALLPVNHPGIEAAKRHYPVYLSFMNGPVRGKDVFIPIEWIIGGPKMAGHGWRMLMECLSVGRGISLPALSAGGAKLGYLTTGAYSKLREQFKVSIGKFEGVQEEMAELAANAYMLEASRLFTAGAVDQGAKPSLASAIAKYHMTEMCRKNMDIMMDIHAGRGIQAGPRNYLVNGYLAIPVAITVEGANILTRNLMIFGQGAVRCHPYIFDEMQALSNENEKEGLKKFDRLLLSHIGYTLSNLARSLWYGLSGGRFVPVTISGQFKSYYQQLTRASSALALFSDMAMLILGGDLKRRENLSARLGDVLSYLYLASASLKFYADHPQAAEDKLHLQWILEHCLFEAQEAFYGIFENFPSKAIAYFLKRVIFPWGRSFARPKDVLSRRLADIMLTQTDLKDRLTKHCYYAKNTQDPVGRVVLAFHKMLEVEPLMKKLHEVQKRSLVSKQAGLQEKVDAAERAGFITAAEASSIREFDAMRYDAMLVDDFTHIGKREAMQ